MVLWGKLNSCMRAYGVGFESRLTCLWFIFIARTQILKLHDNVITLLKKYKFYFTVSSSCIFTYCFAVRLLCGRTVDVHTSYSRFTSLYFSGFLYVVKEVTPKHKNSALPKSRTGKKKDRIKFYLRIFLYFDVIWIQFVRWFI